MLCSLCGGALKLLGQLGARVHFRCEDCGMDCSRLASELDDILN